MDRSNAVDAIRERFDELVSELPPETWVWEGDRLYSTETGEDVVLEHGNAFSRVVDSFIPDMRALFDRIDVLEGRLERAGALIVAARKEARG